MIGYIGSSTFSHRRYRNYAFSMTDTLTIKRDRFMRMNSTQQGRHFCSPSWVASACGLVLVFLSGPVCAAATAIPTVEQKSPVAFKSDEPGRPLFLKQLKTRFEAPGIIGEAQAGWLCTRTGDVVWNQATLNITMPVGMLSSRFRTELEHAGYPVPVASDAVFEEKKNPALEKPGNGPLQVGVFVKEIALNFCSKGSGEWTGGAYVKLNWQVFAPEIQKVVYEMSTEGSYKRTDAPVKGSFSAFTAGAFTVAARNLLADPGFLKAVTTPITVDAAATTDVAHASEAATQRLQVDGAVGNSEPLTQKMTQLRAAVATVFGDAGSGSGFFIGTNGILLTNQHVVGKAKFVKVRLPTGRELVGEVVRADPARDVALVKTEPAGVPPLALRTSDAVIGEDVFALGSPLGDSFNSTLTKGILSGVREMGNQPYLQSDVAILPGNSGGPLLDKSGQVIGVTVMGLGAKGMAGMNFFVPIGDALVKLGVQMAPKKL